MKVEIKNGSLGASKLRAERSLIKEFASLSINHTETKFW